MSHEESDKSDQSKSVLTRLHERREWFYLAIDLMTHPVGPFITRFFDVILGKMLPYWARRVRNCDTRDELYAVGREMLESARNDVTTVSTIRGEHPSAPSANKIVREYFIELCRIVYRNRLHPSKTTNIVRYSNLKDAARCHEALSLLYYGAGVTIRHSEVPIEFVTTDGEKALIGFPGANGLFGGFRSWDPQKCLTLASWVTAYCSADYAATTSPHALAAQIEELRAVSGQPEHDSDCLCQVAKVLKTESVVKACGEMFDQTSDWIDGIYDPSDVQTYYSALAQAVRYRRGSEMNLSFLDVGCGTALGVNELKKHDFSYWGLDVSEPMIAKARDHLGDPVGWSPKAGHTPRFNVFRCDAIGALLGVDPRAKDFIRAAPKKFDVIACQGNSFDSFIGPIQKELALYLFDQRLHEKGYLVFTGGEFSNGAPSVERKPIVGGMERSIQYEFDWAGEYCRLNVKTGGHMLETSVVMHPCRREWLTRLLGTLGYEPVDPVAFPVRHVTPRGGQRYYTWVFQKIAGRKTT